MEVFYDSLDEENDDFVEKGSGDAKTNDVIPFYNGNISKTKIKIDNQSKIGKKMIFRRTKYLKDNKKKSYLDLMLSKQKPFSEVCLNQEKASENPDETIHTDDFLSNSFASCLSICDCSISNISLDSKLLSVSQRAEETNKKRILIRSHLTNIPSLGGLGPNIKKDKVGTRKLTY